MMDDEIRAVVAQLEARPASAELLVRLASEPDIEVLATRLFAAGLSIGRLAWIVIAIAHDRLGPIGLPLASDPDPVVRAGVFYAWGLSGEGVDAQARFQPPRWRYAWERDPLFVDFLHLGLRDPVARVRDAAARLAYLARAGHHVADALHADLASEEPSPWSAAALGTTTDTHSLVVLRALVEEDDDRLAGMAVHALAARQDGHADAVRATRHPRSHVRWSAAMAIGLIAVDVDPSLLADLDTSVEDVRAAVVHYRARQHSME